MTNPTSRRPRWHLIWIPIALFFSFFVYFIVTWGLKPKPIAQINPTSFEQPEQVGAVFYRRLRNVLRQEKMVVLGSSPWVSGYDRIWNGFIAAAREDGIKIPALFEDPSLRPIKDFSGMARKAVNWPAVSPEEMDAIKESVTARGLVLVHTTYNLSAHRGETSVVKDLEKSLKRPWTALTMLSFATNAEEAKALQPTCRDELNSWDRSDYVACSALRISKRFFRKKLDSGRIWAAAERHGLQEYFLFVHEPQNQPASL